MTAYGCRQAYAEWAAEAKHANVSIGRDMSIPQMSATDLEGNTGTHTHTVSRTCLSKRCFSKCARHVWVCVSKCARHIWQAYAEWAAEAKHANVSIGRDMSIPPVPARGYIKMLSMQVKVRLVCNQPLESPNPEPRNPNTRTP